MRGRRHRNLPVRIPVILAIGLAACASASWAQDRGTCVTANVPEAFTLPNGSEHVAGRLTLCALQALSPVVELHSVSVDGSRVSLAISRRAVPEGYVDTRSAFLFQRGTDGVLDLVGYVVPFGGKSWSYRMNRTAVAATRAALDTETREVDSTSPKG